MIRGDMLSVILACTLGFAAMHIKLRSSARDLLPLSDVALMAAIIVFACWKAGPLLSEPEMLWESPLKIVTLPGALDGVLFGVILAAVYVLNRLRKLSIPLWAALDGFVFFAMAGGLVYAALTAHYGYGTTLPWGMHEFTGGEAYHPVHLYAAIVFAAGLTWAWRKYFAFGSGQALRFALLLIGLGGLTISLFAPQASLLFRLSGFQLVCILFAVAGLLASRITVLQQTYTNSGKELSDMPNKRGGDSIAQRKQEKQNKTSSPGQNVVDKKLDGPNRPST